MKKSDVQIGGTYLVKVASNLVPVKIASEHDNGGWEGVSVKTGKTIRIKTAQRLRKSLDTGAGDKPKRSKKKLTLAERKALHAQHKADQENARLRDEREVSPDGQTASERAMAETPGSETTGSEKPKAKKLSALNAAAQVLTDADEPMSTRQMIEAMAEKGLWTSDAPTPANTLYAAISREIKVKGDASRFIKAERGKFAITKKGA